MDSEFETAAVAFICWLLGLFTAGFFVMAVTDGSRKAIPELCQNLADVQGVVETGELHSVCREHIFGDD